MGSEFVSACHCHKEDNAETGKKESHQGNGGKSTSKGIRKTGNAMESIPWQCPRECRQPSCKDRTVQ